MVGVGVAEDFDHLAAIGFVGLLEQPDERQRGLLLEEIGAQRFAGLGLVPCTSSTSSVIWKAIPRSWPKRASVSQCSGVAPA